MSELFESLEKRDSIALQELLSYTSSNFLENDISPLMYTAYWGMFDIAQLLLESGAEIDMENSMGKTPLHFAAIGNRVPVVQLLCAKGAQVDFFTANVTPG